MRQKIFTLILFIYSPAFAKETTPLIKGNINISISKGTFTCDLILENETFIEDYLILLNAGMNIRSIKDPAFPNPYYYERTYNGEISYEAFGYYLPNNTLAGKFIRRQLAFNYTGQFPVVRDTLNTMAQDWKGNIAFNGYSIRADGRQAAWYPVLYDVKKDKKYDKVRYDITVNCAECTSIYINGSNPVPGSIAHLKSDEPVEMLLYAGQYKVNNVDGTFFLNADVEEWKLKNFGTLTNSFKKYYESRLGIPYKYNITYLASTPVSKNNAWLFVSYPTIAMIGHPPYGIHGMFNKEDARGNYAFIAHELAHYYFGSFRNFNSETADMITEGFAEYMSAKLMKHFYGDSAYQNMLTEWTKNVKDFKPTPVSKLTSSKDYGSRQQYVYNYIPLLLTAIEQEAGMPVMWQWMKNMLNDNTAHTNYTFLQSSLAKALSDSTKMKRINAQYFEGEHTLEHALEKTSR